jgi:hypothetical protein
MGMIDILVCALGIATIIFFIAFVAALTVGLESDFIDVVMSTTLITGLTSIAGFVYVWITEHRLVGE